MSDHRPRPIDRDTAEHLLLGVPVDQDGSLDPLAALLAAAAAPARPAELAGEQAALAAFRQAQLAPPVAALARRSRVAKLLSVKVAALTLAATGLGGVAVAAGSGALPTPIERKTPTAAPSPSRTVEPTTPRTHDAPAPPPASPEASRSATPSASPSASVTELCRVWIASPDQERRKALRSPEFAPVVKAAGGKKKVAKYCKQLAGTERRRDGADTEKTPQPTSTTGDEGETKSEEDADSSVLGSVLTLTG